MSVMWGAAQALSPEGGEALRAGDGELLTGFKYLLLALDRGLPSNKGKAVFHRSVRQFDDLADKVQFGQFSGLAVQRAAVQIEGKLDESDDQRRQCN